MNRGSESARRLRRKMSANSILDFANTYFPHYMTQVGCAFHKEICDILMHMSDRRNGRLAIAAPRGYAKSTIVSFIYVMWLICHSKEQFILILSATAMQAQTLLTGISRELQANNMMLSDFADVFSEKKHVKTKWAKNEIISPNDIKITALGAGQDLRGLKHNEYRPSLIILDDVDGEKNTYNTQSREKIFNWFTQAVLKAGAAKSLNMVAVGTLLHTDSLLGRLTRKEEFPDWNKPIYKAVERFSTREDLWQRWGNVLYGRGDAYDGEVGLPAADRLFRDNKDDMLKDTKVLWEDMEDYYALMKIRALEGSYSFDSEKQNDPTNAKECRYDPEKFYYWYDEFPTVAKLLESFNGDYAVSASCDPSVGLKNGRSDYSAIIVIAKHKGKIYVLEADIAQRSQDDLVQAMINYCKIYPHMEKFVIEANLFPELLLKTVRERAYKENILVPFKEVRNTRNKELRIFGMETYITTGTVLFSRKHTMLLDQLKYFPRGDHDDGPDALEMVLREAEINQVGFLPLTDDAKDRHGRGLNHPDFGRTTPEEDARDDDDEDGVGAGIFAG